MESIWSKTSDRVKRPLLDSDIHADVAVIGGGMAGILTAYQLEQSGMHAVVLEADQQTESAADRRRTLRQRSHLSTVCSVIHLLRKSEKKPQKNMYRPIRVLWRNTKGSCVRRR